MLNIIITQKSKFDYLRNEYNDVLDQAFSELFSGYFNLIPVPNKIVKVRRFMENLNCQGVILSGGNSIVDGDNTFCARRICLENEVLNYAFQAKIPVVGICYGMQFINQYLGGQIKPIDCHVNVTHVVKFNDISIKVNSFHNYGISKQNLSDRLDGIGIAEDGSVECCIHKLLPWLGVMWHPERAYLQHEAWINFIRDVFLKKVIVGYDNILRCIKGNQNNFLREK